MKLNKIQYVATGSALLVAFMMNWSGLAVLGLAFFCFYKGMK